MQDGSSKPRAFDPYFRWLSIPPNEQPPDFYRLLDIARFESDAEVIERAAEQQMDRVRSHEHGSHPEWCQKLLKELSAARFCLMDPDTRSAYDNTLVGDRPDAPEERLESSDPPYAHSRAGSSHAPPVLPSPSRSAIVRRSPSAAREEEPENNQSLKMLVIAGGGVAAVLVVAVLLWVGLGSGLLGVFSSSPSALENENTGSPTQQTGGGTTPRPGDPSSETPRGETVGHEPEESDDTADPAEESSTTPGENDFEITGIFGLPQPDAAAPDEPAIDAQPVPSSADLSAARESLARPLRELPAAELLIAADEHEEPAERFVLLGGARDVATAKGDAELAFRALHTLAREFEIDGPREKVNLLETLGSAAQTAGDYRQLAEEGIKVTTEVLESSRIVLADKSAEITLKYARASGETSLARAATLLVIEISRRHNGQ